MKDRDKIEYHYDGMFCPHCDTKITPLPHYGAVFINGYPAPCPNNGKLFFDGTGKVSEVIVWREPFFI